MTLWKSTAGGVGLADELFTARTPCGVRPRDRDTVGAAHGPDGSIPRSRLPRQRCLIRLRSGESPMPAVFGRPEVQPDTGHGLRPHRVIQGMDQPPDAPPRDCWTGQETLRLLPGRPPPADERSPHQRNHQEKRAIALLLRQESRYRLRRARQTLPQRQAGNPHAGGANGGGSARIGRWSPEPPRLPRPHGWSRLQPDEIGHHLHLQAEKFSSGLDHVVELAGEFEADHAE
jgi:hypothetical protein